MGLLQWLNNRGAKHRAAVQVRRQRWARAEAVKAFNIVRTKAQDGRVYDAVVYAGSIVISMPEDINPTERLAAIREMYEDYLLAAGYNPKGWSYDR